MKTRTRYARTWLRGLLVLAGIVATLQVAPRTARACGWSDPWNCAADLAKGAWNGIVAASRQTAQFAVNLWGQVATISCDVSIAGSLEARCFGDRPAYLGLLGTAIDFVDADPRTDFTRGLTTSQQTYSPTGFMHDRIAYLLDGASWEVQNVALATVAPDPGALATTECVSGKNGAAAPVIVWPTAYPYFHDDASGGDDFIGLAATLVHESDHTRVCAHTCGSGADNTEDGPYGTEIQWLAKVYRSGNPGYALSPLDRNLAWFSAVSRLTYNICDADAQSRLWNAFLVDLPSSWDQHGLTQSAASTWATLTSPWVSKVAAADVNWSSQRVLYGLGGDGAVYAAWPGGAWGGPLGSWPSGSPVPFADLAAATDGSGSVFGVGNDGAVYFCQAGTWSWSQATQPWVSRIAVTPDGFIYGIGGDNAVYRTTVGGSWSLFASPAVTNISVTPDGSVYGVGTDNTIYTTSGGNWTQVSQGRVTQISVTASGFIYGLGLDNRVYVTRKRPTSDTEQATSSAAWTPVTDGQVTHIAVSSDGFIYGVDLNGAIEVHGSQESVLVFL